MARRPTTNAELSRQLGDLLDAVHAVQIGQIEQAGAVRALADGQTRHETRLDRIDARLEDGARRFHVIDVQDAKRTGAVVGATKTLAYVGGAAVFALSAIGSLILAYGTQFLELFIKAKT